MKQRRPLNAKELKFIEAKVQGKNNPEAAMIATGAKTARELLRYAVGSIGS